MKEPEKGTCQEVSCIESAVKEINDVAARLDFATDELMERLNPVLRGADEVKEVDKPGREGECVVHQQLLAHADRLELSVGFVHQIRDRLCT